MKKPTREEIIKVIRNNYAPGSFAGNGCLIVFPDQVADAVMKLYGDEPTTPKWFEELSTLLRRLCVDPRSNSGLDLAAFVREKLKKFADEIVCKSKGQLSPTGIELLNESIARASNAWGIG